MKSLDELASRLEAANTKLDQADAKAEKRIPISSLPFTIDAPGSYYLTGNLTGVAGQNGITIAAKHVTVDLNGFRLAGPGQNGVFSSAEQIAVRNGSIDGWSISGIASAGTGALIDNIRANGNGHSGISVGPQALVQSCTVASTGAVSDSGRGISTGAGSVVSKCTVAATTGPNAVAIRVGDGSTVVDCAVRDTTANGGYGISSGTGSTVSRCEVTASATTAAGINAGNNSRVIDCVSSVNTNSDGIRGDSRVLISGCTVNSNGDDGITVESNCVVLNNVVTSNTANGIHAAGARTDLKATARFSTRPMASGCPPLMATTSSSETARGEHLLEFHVATGNAFGPVATRVSVTDGTNTNPHANFDLD